MEDLAINLAGLVSWEDVRALSGWAGLLSILIVLALTERMRRVFVSREDLTKESEDRKKADHHRDERMHAVSELVQQYIGKIDLLRDRMNEQDRAREREVADLREEVRTGFARMEALLGGGNRPPRRD